MGDPIRLHKNRMVRADGRPLNVTSYAAIRENKSISVML